MNAGTTENVLLAVARPAARGWGRNTPAALLSQAPLTASLGAWPTSRKERTDDHADRPPA
jgi:hypothetical protein